MNRLILTDIDGTVLRFDLAFERWMAAQGLVARAALRDLYGIADVYGIREDEVHCYIRDFCRQDEFARLPAEDCAQTVLPRLHDAGWDFIAITAVPHEPEVVAARMENLKAVFGFDWLALHCTGTHHGSKDRILSTYRPAIWVEDHGDNAVVGAEAGHRTFLLDRAYNENIVHPSVLRVDDWHEIERLIVA